MSILSSHAALHLVERFGPGLVGVSTALEATGLPLPGESLLIATAVYAGTSGRLSIFAVVAAAAIGAIVGDNIGYIVGRTLGYGALRRFGRHVGLTEQRLALGRYLFRRHGRAVVFAGRFVAFLRTVVALLAGANRMDWGPFLLANAAGGICWAALYGFSAYLLGDEVRRISGPAAIGLGIAAAIAVVAGVVYLRRNEARLTDLARREAARG